MFPDGSILRRGPGSVALLEHLGPLRPLGRACRLLRLAPFLGALNAVVSRHRAQLGRVVPDGPAPRRFP